MKKIIIIIFLLFLSILIFLKFKKDEVEIIKYRDINTVSDFDEIIQTKNKNIDTFLKNEISIVSKRIKENYSPLNVALNYSFDIIKDKNYISYLINVKVISEDSVIKEVQKVYNFSLNTSNQIVLNDIIIKDVYLDQININLNKHNLIINFNDFKYINYIVYKDVIKFIIPREVTFSNEIIIELKNKGVDYKAVISEQVDEKKKLVALTFDDGPSTKTNELVDLLNKHDIKATFFLLGERVKYYPDAVMYMVNYNHEIGNHSYTHPNFYHLNIENVLEEINKTQDVIYDLTKSYPKLFRFPYGSYNNSSLNYINLPIIFWNADSLDWKYIESNIIINNVLTNLSDKTVILFHDNSKYKKEAIEGVIKYLKSHNYEFVTVSELYDFRNIENSIYGKIYY